MRIVIAEAFSDIPKETIEEFENADYTTTDEDGNFTKENMAKSIVDEYANPVLSNIKSVLSTSVQNQGLDTRKNKFLALMDKINFTPSANSKDKFAELLKMYNQDGIDVTKDYLTRESTYEVDDMTSFKFAINVLDTLNNSSKLSKYFINTDGISEEQLYVGNDVSNELKPLGNKGDNGDETLIGVVNSWSGENGSNDIDNDSGEERIKDDNGPTLDSGDYAVLDALRQQGVSESDYLEFFVDTIYELFKNGKCKYKPLNNNVEFYTNLISLIFSTQNKPLKQNELKQIKSKHFVDIKHIPDSMKKDGSVVYVYYKEFKGGENANADLSEDNVINDFIIYKGNRWIRYDNNNIPNYQKYKNILLKCKTVEDKSSHYSIVDGVLKALDTSTFDDIKKQI